MFHFLWVSYNEWIITTVMGISLAHFFIKSTSSKIGLPSPGGLEKIREKMCKTFACPCMSTWADYCAIVNVDL